MALLEIITGADNPILLKESEPVSKIDKEILKLIRNMKETLSKEGGLGLAAPQVGVLQRVVVVETPKEEDEPGSGRFYAVINPEILRSSEEQVEGIEGCLSIPGYVGEVTRHEAVTIKGQDVRGRRIRIKAQGFLARVFQHEIDHLEGVLFIDQLTAPDRVWRVEEGQEEQAELRGTTGELVPAELPLELTHV